MTLPYELVYALIKNARVRFAFSVPCQCIHAKVSQAVTTPTVSWAQVKLNVLTRMGVCTTSAHARRCAQWLVGPRATCLC